jgi:16S rRNA (cytosine967-C5)-methyltransferase
MSEATGREDLAERSAHPGWIVERWVAQYGFDTTKRICEYDQQIPATSLRLRDSQAIV